MPGADLIREQYIGIDIGGTKGAVIAGDGTYPATGFQKFGSSICNVDEKYFLS